ncbi:MAG: class I SAM-dependent methyltransferase [Cyanobacteria bacterium P01_H01_bin.119]
MTQQPISTAKLTGVPETLMITLYARFIETQRPSPILRDPKAVEIAEQVDYDFAKYSKGWASQLGCVVRAKEFDRVAQDFIRAYPDGTVVNLGSGLCTRFTRVDNGQIRWYEVDFPEVLELRRQFFEESDRYRLIAQSILDFTWIDQIERSPAQPILIILEGVTPYLNEADNREIIRQIGARLAPADIIFDVLSRKSAENSERHDTVSKTDAKFKWGIDDAKALETWAPGITLTDEVLFLTQFANHRDRLPLWARYITFILVPLFKTSGRILQLQVRSDQQ